jgi:hypothetical protein
MDVTPRLASVYARLQTGQFLLGLEELEHLYDAKRQHDRLLKGEFLLRTGKWQESESLIRSVADNRSSQPPLVARALELLAHHSRLRGGDLPDPVKLLERSLDLGGRGGEVAPLVDRLYVHGTDLDIRGGPFRWRVPPAGSRAINQPRHLRFVLTNRHRQAPDRDARAGRARRRG